MTGLRTRAGAPNVKAPGCSMSNRAPEPARDAGPAPDRGVADYFFWAASASWTLPTMRAEGVSVLSPSSFHLAGQTSVGFFER